MKWLVGLDLRPSSQGALHFATWLRDRSVGQELRAVHVVEAGSASEGFATLEEPARAATERMLARTQARPQFTDVSVVAGPAPHTSLLAAATQEQADGIIVGREGASSVTPADRLGQVSRHLLRALVCPVVVTRPDLHPRDVGLGPVVLATDLSADGAAALSFAATLASDLERELVVAHVQRRFEHPAIYKPDSDWAGAAKEQDRTAKAAVNDWVASHEVSARTIVDEGITTRRLLDIAHVEEACLLVCGSRVHGDIHLSATGTELAASARVPIAVVPPAPSAGR